MAILFLAAKSKSKVLEVPKKIKSSVFLLIYNIILIKNNYKKLKTLKLPNTIIDYNTFAFKFKICQHWQMKLWHDKNSVIKQLKCFQFDISLFPKYRFIFPVTSLEQISITDNNISTNLDYEYDIKYKIRDIIQIILRKSYKLKIIKLHVYISKLIYGTILEMCKKQKIKLYIDIQYIKEY